MVGAGLGEGQVWPFAAHRCAIDHGPPVARTRTCFAAGAAKGPRWLRSSCVARVATLFRPLASPARAQAIRCDRSCEFRPDPPRPSGDPVVDPTMPPREQMAKVLA